MKKKKKQKYGHSMTVIFKMVLSLDKQFLLLRNNIFHYCTLKIRTINVGFIFNKIKYRLKYLENIGCS